MKQKKGELIRVACSMLLCSRRRGMSRQPKEGLFLENGLKMKKEALLLESEGAISY